MDNKILALNRFFELCFANPKGSTGSYLRIATPDTNITSPAIWGHVIGDNLKEGSGTTTIDFGTLPTTQAGYSKLFSQLGRLNNYFIPTLHGIPNQEKMSRVFANPLGAFTETEEKADTTTISYHNFLNQIQEKFGGKVFEYAYLSTEGLTDCVIHISDADGIVGMCLENSGGNVYQTFDSFNLDGADLNLTTLNADDTLHIFTIKDSKYDITVIKTASVYNCFKFFYKQETSWDEFDAYCDPKYEGVVCFPEPWGIIYMASCKFTNNWDDVVYISTGGMTTTIQPGKTFTFNNTGPSYPQNIIRFRLGDDIYNGVLENIKIEPVLGSYQIVQSKKHY